MNIMAVHGCHPNRPCWPAIRNRLTAEDWSATFDLALRMAAGSETSHQ